MNHDASAPVRERSFSSAMSGIVVLGLFSYASALVGIFFRSAVLGFTVPVLIMTIVLLFRWLLHDTVSTKIIFGCSIVLAVSLLLPAEPSVFSGRDQGSIAEAAIELAHHGRLHFSSPAVTTFFGIYGPGKALNFPGFSYTENGELTTQFPIGSIAFLGMFVSLFGISGLLVANGVLLVASLSTLFMLVRTLSDERYAVGTFAAAAVSFPLLWFSKFTLSENLSLFLFLSLAFCLIRFLRKPDPFAFFLPFLIAVLLAATRVEGLFSLIVTVAVLFVTPSGRTFSKRNRLLFRLVPIVLLTAALCVNLFSSVPFYKSVGKALLQNQFAVKSPIVTDSLASAFDLWSLFVTYGLLLPFVFGLISIVILLFNRRFLALIPAALALPAFLFLIEPNITPDHPWMLRRFLFSLWPTFFVSAPVALFLIMRDRKPPITRSIPAVMLVLVISFSLPATVRSFSLSENRGLIGGTATLANQLGDRDLLLIDREATGNPYAIPAGPLRFLYGKNAVYFFNPSDYEKIPKNRYDHIYLLTSLDTLDSFSKIPAVIGKVNTMTFSSDGLERLSIRDNRLPNPETIRQTDVLIELKPL